MSSFLPVPLRRHTMVGVDIGASSVKVVEISAARGGRARRDLGGQAAARFEYKSDTERGLLYVLPRAQRYLLVRFVSPGSSYGQKEAQVERALGTLRIHD